MLDPYRVLEVSPSASDAEVRAAYRRLVQLHHPDHNNGSAESARRFEEVQDAYAQVRAARAGGRGAAAAGPPHKGPAAGASSPDPDLDARLAQMERELRAARDARERVVRKAREAKDRALREARAATGRSTGPGRPSDEELGYFSTDDSFSKIVDDAASELSERWSEARKSPTGHKVSDLIDELASKLTGERHNRE